MDNYYLLEDGEQTGPFTLQELIDQGPDIHTQVLPAGESIWKDACDLPELFEYFMAQGIDFPTEDNLASFWIRLGAFIIDTILLSFLLDFLFIALSSYGLMPNITAYTSVSAAMTALNKMPGAERLLIQATMYLSVIVYNSVCETSKMKGSIGKKICKLVVVDADGDRITLSASLLRGVCKVVILYFFGIGFLSIFWSQYRQGLHDYLAKTYVVKRG